MSSELKRELGFWDLVLFHITAIVGLRWLAVAAGIGYASISLWVLAFLVFFLPQAYVVVKLSRKWPVEGGLYEWTKMALGPFHGYVSGWCYWVNNITYYPSLMAAAAGFAAYIFVGTQHWEESRLFVVSFSLVSFWLVVWLEMVGLKIGKWVQNAGAISTWVAAVLPVVLGAAYLMKFGSVTPFDSATVIPDPTRENLSTWAFLCFAMAGFELISLMGGEIKDPEINIPRSIVVGGAIATLIYILGTISLIVSVPHGTISMISGILQALTEQSRVFKLWLLPNAVAVLLVIGQFGGAGAWLAGSGRMLLVVGVDRYMPKSFSKIHPRWGTPHVAILVQAVIASVIVLMSAFGTTVQQFYRLLLDYNLIIYFIPYLYLFVAYLQFMRKGEMPMNLAGILSVVLGFSATLIAIVLSFLPPPNEPDVLGYEAKVWCVFIAMLGSGLIFYARARRRPTQ
jgi:amino acid transporter